MFITFIIAFLLNLQIIVFGSKFKELLKQKISIMKYVNEILKSSEETIGKDNTKILKIILSLMFLFALIFNFYFFIKIIIAFLLGTWSAKKLYQIPKYANYINKISTYIVRLFK